MIPRNSQQDIDRLRQAAEQGEASAQVTLGVLYARGKGVLENYREAVNWFRAAAEQGFSLAQFNLGFLYAKGKGVPKDYVEAYAWMNLAAAQGHGKAVKGKAHLRQQMSRKQVSEAQKRAAEMFRRMAPSRPQPATASPARIPDPAKRTPPVWRNSRSYARRRPPLDNGQGPIP